MTRPKGKPKGVQRVATGTDWMALALRELYGRRRYTSLTREEAGAVRRVALAMHGAASGRDVMLRTKRGVDARNLARRAARAAARGAGAAPVTQRRAA